MRLRHSGLPSLTKARLLQQPGSKGRLESKELETKPYPPALGAKFCELVAQSLDWRSQALAKYRPVPSAIKSEGARLGHGVGQ